MVESGKKIFTTHDGAQYLIDNYLNDSDKHELSQYNNGYQRHIFKKKLIEKIEKGSGGKHFIKSNYEDDLVENAGAIIGTNRHHEKLKNGRTVEAYDTNGYSIYEDKRGRLRHLRTGRYASKDIFEE